ncbi:MAG TPA: hypothetical protein VGQ06_01455 [Gemmatimonadales bacterium]|jgi:hypothetical protein|nr:hypothetical protein [Gemmatimonadales bacterium]
MSRPKGMSAVLLATLAGVACGSHRVLVPPRLDLHPYQRLGLVTFTVENAKGTLHQFATERFAENVLAAQPGIEVLELGNIDTLMQRVGEREVGVATARELGRQHGVGAVFAGHLKITNPQASGGIAGLLTPRLEARVRTDLTVRLLSTQSGGTVWRSSAWATQKVGGVSLEGGQLNFAARDPKTAYGPMVNTIVNIVTRDLWSTWQKQ